MIIFTKSIPKTDNNARRHMFKNDASWIRKIIGKNISISRCTLLDLSTIQDKLTQDLEI
jgi:hypothetical protein